MNDHQKFEALLNELGLSRIQLAKEIGMSYKSVTNQLAPSKKLPRWAISMLLVKKLKEDSNKF